MVRIPAPKPPNFADMCDAWDQPETFAALVRDYYAFLGAQRATHGGDLTEPRYSKDNQ